MTASTPTPRADLAASADSSESAAPDSFLRRPFVQDVLPFISSLVIHLSILAFGLLTYKTIQIMTRVKSVEPPVMPTSVMQTEMETKLGFPDGDAPTTYTTALPDVPRTVEGLADKPSTATTLTLAGGADAGDDDPAIAIGASAAFKNGKGGGNGVGVGPGTENGEAGLATLGHSPTRGFGAPFMNFGGAAARKVLFLCDSSGSMMNKFDVLRVEIRKSIDVLRPVQSFDVIFFSNDSFVALDRQLLPAVPETKRKAFEFLEGVTPRSTSDPIPGLRAAFAANPQLIYMLTDGDFPNNQQVLEEVRKLQARRAVKIKINTIAFMDRGDDYEKLLKSIAEESGGLFKFVADTDLAR